MAERGWFGGCSPGLDFHPGALSVSFLTLSKSSSLGLEPGDFQPEDGEQSLALGVFKIKKGPRDFGGQALPFRLGQTGACVQGMMQSEDPLGARLVPAPRRRQAGF